METLRQVEEKEPERPSSIHQRVDRDLETICLKCLEKDPQRRYGSAEALAEDLEHWLRQEPIRGRRSSAVNRAVKWARRNPAIASLAAAVMVVAAIGFAQWLLAKDKAAAEARAKDRAQQLLDASDLFLAQQALGETNLSHVGELLNGLERALTRQPTNPILWNAKGVLLEKTNGLAQAYALFSKAIELASANKRSPQGALSQALSNRCNLLKRMDRFAEAGLDYRRFKGLPLPGRPGEPTSVKSLPDYHLATTVSVELGTTNRESGLYLIECDDGKTTPTLLANQEGRSVKPPRSKPDVYMYFGIDPTFKWVWGSDVRVEIDYFSRTRGVFGVQFDGAKSRWASCAGDVILTPSEQWKRAEFQIWNARFQNSQNGNADFRLIVLAPELAVRRVTVTGLTKMPQQELRTPGLLTQIPPRNPEASPRLIDLSDHYNASLTRNWETRSSGDDLSSLGTGLQTLAGVKFDVRGLIQLGYKSSHSSRRGEQYPPAVRGIKVGQRCQQLHFLHAGSAVSDVTAKTRIARYLIHYADGSSNSIPILKSRELDDWWDYPPPAGPPMVVAWKGTNRVAQAKGLGIRLFKTTWANPQPDSLIQTIDLVSEMTNAGAFVVAITAESMNVPEFWVMKAEKLEGEGNLSGALATLDEGVKASPASLVLWTAKGNLLGKASRPNEALQAFAKAIDLAAADTSAFGRVLTEARLGRSALLRRMNRLEEAAADNLTARGIPARAPQARPNLVDLSPFYNFALTNDLQDGVAGNNAATLPQGLQQFGGIEFDVRGLIQLPGTELVKKTGRSWPTSATNMPLNRKAARLHFLQGTGWTEPDGTRVGAYVLNYADGQKHELPILYGQHLRDWWLFRQGDEKQTTGARVVWTGANAATAKARGSLRLYLMTGENPRPEVEIKSIDFVSAMTKCGPFLIAITAE